MHAIARETPASTLEPEAAEAELGRAAELRALKRGGSGGDDPPPLQQP